MAGAKPTANNTLRKLQFVSAATLAFSHGANDAQKSMGMLTLVLLLGGFIPKFEVPFWVSWPAPRRSPSASCPAAGGSCARSALPSIAYARCTPCLHS
jgi:hypothetical protein